jgi:hypothetical protein
LSIASVQYSAAGEPAEALQDPSQSTVPDLAHAPTPTVHAWP